MKLKKNNKENICDHEINSVRLHEFKSPRKNCKNENKVANKYFKPFIVNLETTRKNNEKNIAKEITLKRC